ncbi:hypothetical protein J2847_005120 [Azospirillum agricola]|uniref:hypothetical protein n=1 Tax=Azospirillum agricola TaxID=1720247 RepID=UPI001AE7D641|nr:hypothetical protein [Azospirillum agricola]MBP2231801.1 hypothetical protein [Azospirillum agricola]
MTAARIQAALYGAFSLPVPPVPPVPADPHQFPAIFARPVKTALTPQRLAVGGTITTAPTR